MSTDNGSGSPTGGPDPDATSGLSDGSTATQRQQVLDLLQESDAPLTDLEVESLLEIPYSSAGPRLVELFDLGLAEPLPKKRKKDRQRWQAVPFERQETVKEAAVRRTKARLLRTFQRQPMWLQGWLVGKILAPNIAVDRQEQLLKEECPDEKKTGSCTCPTTNVWVQRHNKKVKSMSRVRREAIRWWHEQRELKKERDRAQEENSPLVQYLADKELLRGSIHGLLHMEARVKDETDLRRQFGIGDINDSGWRAIREMVEEAQDDMAAVVTAINFLVDDVGDFVDVEDIEDAEVLELDAGDYIDAEIEDEEVEEPRPGEE
jgi:hypothetical protein